MMFFFEKQGFTMVLMYLLESQMETNGYMMGKHCALTPSTVCVNSFHRCGGERAPLGLGD